MATITRYVLVDRNDVEGNVEYEDMAEAIDICDDDHAVIERTYEYADSEVVYTPDGSNVWPPKPDTRAKFFYCGGCDHLHPFGWTGDCRDDSQRFTYDRIETLHGRQDEGWIQVNEETGEIE